MYDVALVAIVVLISLGLPIGLGLLFYFVPKKLGYPKTAKYLAIVYGLLVLIVTFFVVFEDQMFSKNDARKLIEEQNLKLVDKFELLNNKSSSALGADYYHTFKLKISGPDKQQAIEIIKSSKIFKTDKRSINRLLYLGSDRYFGPIINQDYETEDSYVREYFQPGGRQGYAPTFRRISISKTENILTFEDIAE